MKVLKNKLSVSEIEAIGNKMAETQGFVGRQIVKNMAILDICTDVEVKDEMTYDEYQKFVDDGTIDELLSQMENDGDCDAQCKSVIDDRNYNMMVQIREDIDSVLKNINDSIDSYEKKANEQGTDLESIIKKMKEIANDSSK